MEKPISRRMSVVPVAVTICPDKMLLMSVPMTVTPPGSFGIIIGGNMNVGKNPSLDITSHIPMITAMNTIRLKTVAITKLLLQHLFHFNFKLCHHAFFKIHDDAVCGIAWTCRLNGKGFFYFSWTGAHKKYAVR